MPSIETLPCEKCHQGRMLPARVPRMGDALNTVGFLLLIPAIILTVIAAGCGVLVGGTAATFDGMKEQRVKVSSQLLDIREVPRAAAEEFARTGRLEPAVVQALSPQARADVDRILSFYNAAAAGNAVGSGLAVGAAGLGVVGTLVLSLPMLVAGLLLIRKKHIWRCESCGYGFDQHG